MPPHPTHSQRPWETVQGGSCTGKSARPTRLLGFLHGPGSGDASALITGVASIPADLSWRSCAVFCCVSACSAMPGCLGSSSSSRSSASSPSAASTSRPGGDPSWARLGGPKNRSHRAISVKLPVWSLTRRLAARMAANAAAAVAPSPGGLPTAPGSITSGPWRGGLQCTRHRLR